MKASRIWICAVLPVLAVGLVWLSGCTSKDTGGSTSGPPSGGSSKKGKGGGSAAKPSGYATLKGTVTYNGPAAAMKVNKMKPTKDADKCPAELDEEGWYVKEGTKNVRYAVVFLKSSSSVKMPKYDEEKNKPASPVVEIRQPKCQFEPRVQVMHPAQRLKAFNDSDIQHDTNLSGPNSYGKTMPPKTDYEFDPEPADTEPYKLSCNIHQGMMAGYIWKFKHPWAATSDPDGKYEIKGVPVFDSGALDVWVWHEMLPDKMKKVGSVSAKDGETATLDIAIPE
jgi:hypothetical protein